MARCLIQRLLKHLLSSLCALFTTLAVPAQNAPDTGPLRVGISPIFPPMVFKQDGILAGAEIDFARGLGKYLGREVTFVELAWEDQIDALNTGRIEIIMSSLSMTVARAHVIDFARPYVMIGQMPLARREDENKYLLGLPAKPAGAWGVLKATTGHYLLQRDFPRTRIKLYKTGADAVKALKSKKIDLFISDSTLVWYLAGVHADQGLAAVRLVLSQEQLAWGVRKGNQSLLDAANAYLDSTTKDGTLNQILRRWTAISP